MTFDEAFETVDDNINYCDDNAFDQWYKLLEDLRKEYAPTIEMTKKEYDVFSRAKVDEDSADWIESVEWGNVDYEYPKFMQAWLHPETIKIID